MTEEVKDYITKSEVENTRFIYLYRHEDLGIWTSYGVSAYLSKCLGGLKACLFSREMQMPMTLLGEDDLSAISRKCDLVFRNPACCLMANHVQGYDREGYRLWAKGLRDDAMTYNHINP